jgi:hypothetical protein
MSGLDRLGHEDDAAAALFAAARAYRPPARARRRTLRALGLPVGLSLLASALAQAAQALAPLKVWILAGTVATAGAAGGVVHLKKQASERRQAALQAERRNAVAPTRPSRAAELPVVVAPEVVVEAEADPAPIAEVASVAEAAPARPRVVPRRHVAVVSERERAPVVAEASPAPSLEAPAALTPPRVEAPVPLPALAPPSAPPPVLWAPIAPPPARPAPARSPLAIELGLLGEAKRQLEQGAPRAALERLEDYARQVAQPSLAEEAEVLRITALVAAGDRAQAAARAQAFLRAHERSPLAGRVRSLISATPPGTPGMKGVP